MTKGIFKIKFILVLFVLGMIFSGCNKTATNTAQSSNTNQKVEEVSSSAGSSTENTANAVETNETTNTAANVQISATPDKEQKQKVIDRYIAGVAKVSDASEYKEGRKIINGDLDGDGDEDTAVQFTIEGMGGGNMFSFYLAVFRNENGKFVAVTDEVIGGKLSRSIEFTKIENGRIYFDTKSYAADDGACCPSIPGKTSYIFEANKLVEKKVK